eukprot:1159295-Pelagomonas_calceolata.AAC.10
MVKPNIGSSENHGREIPPTCFHFAMNCTTHTLRRPSTPASKAEKLTLLSCPVNQSCRQTGKISMVVSTDRL